MLDTRLIASGLNQPLFATAPLADGRIFVVEKGGNIRVTQGGITSNFINIPVATSGERGLLGLAFDPGYGDATSAGYRRFFVNYTDPTSLNTVIASYRTSIGNASVADPASRIEVLRVDQPAGRDNHKGGWIGFKPGNANNLYVATGDGGSGNDPDNNAQNTNVLLGKMLRVDINRDDFAADPNRNYAIPVDNPFVGNAAYRQEIYAYGLRNPFRNSFDRQNGNLWIADVGQNAREEIDFISAASGGGQNFGWRIREGNIATPGISDAPVAGLINPLLDYDRSFGASITGGYVVREVGSPLFGRYVFGDFVSGRVFSIAADGSTQTIGGSTELTAMLNAGMAGTFGNISSFGEGANGELYIVDFGGRLIQVVPEPGTFMLMLAGATVMLSVATRRRRKPEPQQQH
ncbi:MAG: PQQ-dependent sugar dehydrogenase [Rubrivivax sp.]